MSNENNEFQITIHYNDLNGGCGGKWSRSHCRGLNLKKLMIYFMMDDVNEDIYEFTQKNDCSYSFYTNGELIPREDYLKPLSDIGVFDSGVIVFNISI